MSADAWGLAILALYLAGGAAAIAHSVRQCRRGWQLWFLNVISRFYTPFFFRQHISADCPFPVDGGALILANHRSPADPMLIYSATPMKRGGYEIRPIEYLTAVEYCDLGGFLGFITRHMGVIPVARSGRDMGPVKEALRRIRDGKLVGVFPEGRINTGTGLLPGNPGIAWLAMHSQAPVYPMFIHNAPQAGGSMVAPFLKFCRVHVTFGEAIDLSAHYGRRINTELLNEITELLMTRLAQLGGVEYTGATTEETAAPAATNSNGHAHAAMATAH